MFNIEKLKKSESGFTLIELIIVILVISIFGDKSEVSPKIHLPRFNIHSQIKGKVQGFPNKVPINAAAIDPLKTQAKVIANSACNPKKGVKEIAIPQAKPMAIS